VEVLMLRKDNLILGIILGFVGPLAGLFIYYFLAFYGYHVSFIEFITYLKENKNFLTGVSSISLIANAVIFTIYLNRYSDKTAKGIFLATLVYGIAVLLIKVIR
jgi:hypothetical protein